jgi:hypothetical protein
LLFAGVQRRFSAPLRMRFVADNFVVPFFPLNHHCHGEQIAKIAFDFIAAYVEVFVWGGPMMLTNSPSLAKYRAKASMSRAVNAVPAPSRSACVSCSFMLDVSIRNGF